MFIKMLIIENNNIFIIQNILSTYNITLLKSLFFKSSLSIKNFIVPPYSIYIFSQLSNYNNNS